MGVDFMEFYKEFFLITLEMCFAIFIAIFGYTLWDNFDQTENDSVSMTCCHFFYKKTE